MNALFRLVAVVLCLAVSGCDLINNKWIRVHRDNPKEREGTPKKMRPPNFRGPVERVEKFFSSYGRKSWDDLESSLTRRSDLRYLQAAVQADFEKYDAIRPKVTASDADFNAARDRARVAVEFEIEKIEKTTGRLYVTRGKGTFVLADERGWDVTGYVGDPFWDKTGP
ncbi:hypothetical protein HY522_07990 [bacterium]|nr:hypothetical protein [bacterium]